MSKEEIKREIEYLRDKQAKYGWRDGDSERFDELQRLWEKCAHIDSKGKYIKAPNKLLPKAGHSRLIKSVKKL